MSVPVESAVKPPNDGMTLPPAACIEEISLPNEAWVSGVLVLPFQYAVQDPALAVWMNANVRYLAPDCWDWVTGLSPLYDSKYGANTCAGSGVALAALAALAVAADAVPLPAAANPIVAAAADTTASAFWRGVLRLMLRVPLASAEAIRAGGTSAAGHGPSYGLRGPREPAFIIN
jgi:hypothetical protein